MISPEEKGAETERRFFEALTKRTDGTPDWFVRVKFSKAAEDIRGVDAKAYIRPKNDGEVTKVPIQIKSSELGAWLYELEMPQLQQDAVLVVVITPRMSDDDIRAHTYSLLTPIHESGARYGWFWEALMKQRFSAYNKQKYTALSIAQRTRAKTK